MATSVARQLRVYGLVQGVYYRASMVAEAQRLGATGWVRNRSDGTVEALVQGAPAVVEALIVWAQRGPVNARVDRVEVGEVSVQALEGFVQGETV